MKDKALKSCEGYQVLFWRPREPQRIGGEESSVWGGKGQERKPSKVTVSTGPRASTLPLWTLMPAPPVSPPN
jgi:hypothetical protein